MSDGEEATYLWVAETVLRKHKRPLRSRELVRYGLEDGLFSDRELSRTPQKSMQARLSLDILANPDGSRFIRTGRGLFYLRDLMPTAELRTDAPKNIREYIAVRREAPPSSENVLVVHRNEYNGILNYQGIKTITFDDVRRLLSTQHTSYLPRTVAEISDEFKQFVTYTIIQHNSSILSFTRGRYNRASSFLRGARCIGFGGHVTDKDHSLFSVDDLGIRANAAREIGEEITLPGGRPDINPDALEVLGILNDDSSDVGVRHVAIILRYWVNNYVDWRTPLRGESSVNQLRWIDTSKEPVNLSDFEYWSQLCIRTFFPSYLNMTPSYRVIKRSTFRSPHLLCVSGAIGSGKSAATKALVDHGGYSQINSGQILAELMGIPPVPQTGRDEFQAAAQSFIATKNGPSDLAKAIAKAARSKDASKIVIDGIRHPETLAALRDISPLPIAVMYVYTPPDVAYDMYRGREDYGDQAVSFHDFVSIYNAPVEQKVKYVLGEADVVLYNWVGLDQYDKIIERMMIDIGASR